MCETMDRMHTHTEEVTTTPSHPYVDPTVPRRCPPSNLTDTDMTPNADELPPHLFALDARDARLATYFDAYSPGRFDVHYPSPPPFRSHPAPSDADHRAYREAIVEVHDVMSIHNVLDLLQVDLSPDDVLHDMLETPALLREEASELRREAAEQATYGGATDPLGEHQMLAKLRKATLKLDDATEVEKRIGPIINDRLLLALAHARYARDHQPPRQTPNQRFEDMRACVTIFRNLLIHALDMPAYICLFARFSVMRKELARFQRALSEYDPPLRTSRRFVPSYPVPPPPENEPDNLSAGQVMEYLGWRDICESELAFYKDGLDLFRSSRGLEEVKNNDLCCTDLPDVLALFIFFFLTEKITLVRSSMRSDDDR